MDTLSDTSPSRNWTVRTQIDKWEREEDLLAGLPPDEVYENEGNLLLNAGITRAINLITGAGGTAYNAANSRIGVGNSTTAASASQTDLQGASKYYMLVTSVTPSSQTITWVATFASADGNFAWEEWGIDNGSSSSASAVAPMLNRKVQSMGTKASGAAWTLTVAITIS